MEAAAEAEGRRQPCFGAVAYAAIVAVARRQAAVHVDDVLAECSMRPMSPNAWGSIWARAIKDGVIVKSGRTRPCVTDRLKRAHEYPIYRSMLFGRATVATVPGRRAPRPAGPPGQHDLFAGGAS